MLVPSVLVNGKLFFKKNNGDDEIMVLKGSGGYGWNLWNQGSKEVVLI